MYGIRGYNKSWKPRHYYTCGICKNVKHEGAFPTYHHDVCYTCQQQEKKIMTPDDLYQAGYNDGKDGKAMNASLNTEPNYMMGYEDGKGDTKMEKPTKEEYKEFNDPPEGFDFTGEKRVPEAYEFYLSKNGSPTFLTRRRKNNQTRHILMCTECGNSSAPVPSGITRICCFHHPEVKGRK